MCTKHQFKSGCQFPGIYQKGLRRLKTITRMLKSSTVIEEPLLKCYMVTTTINDNQSIKFCQLESSTFLTALSSVGEVHHLHCKDPSLIVTNFLHKKYNIIFFLCFLLVFSLFIYDCFLYLYKLCLNLFIGIIICLHSKKKREGMIQL